MFVHNISDITILEHAACSNENEISLYVRPNENEMFNFFVCSRMQNREYMQKAE